MRKGSAWSGLSLGKSALLGLMLLVGLMLLAITVGGLSRARQNSEAKSSQNQGAKTKDAKAKPERLR